MARSLTPASPADLFRPRKTYSFTDFAALSGGAPVPGDRLDTELEELRSSLTAAIDVIQQLLAGTIPIPRPSPALTLVVSNEQPIGAETVTIRRGVVDGGFHQSEDILRPVYDLTPRAQEALNGANAARDAAETVRTAVEGRFIEVTNLHSHVAIQAGAAQDTARQVEASLQDAYQKIATAASIKEAIDNDANHAQLAAVDAISAEQLAWKWAEYLSGPVMTEAEYAAIDPDLIPPGYTYNPVTGMGTAGLWSSKWWAVKAQQIASGTQDAADQALEAAANAQTAADMANQAAADAEAAIDEFGIVYLGTHATPPTLDNNGNPIQVGALYFNSTTDALYVRTSGSTWTQVAAGGSAGAASAISFVPTVGISATNVQLAIEETYAEKLSDAPNDGGTYGRKNAAWISVVSPTVDWAAITGKPSTFPPSAHTHPQSEVTGLVAALAAKAAQTSLDTTNANLATETGTRVTNDDALQANINTETTNRTNADTGLQTQINAKLGDAPSDGALYGRKDAAWAKAVGVSMGIAPPSSPAPGQMWWDADTGFLYVYYADANSSQWVQVNATPTLDTSGFLLKTGGTMVGQLLLPTPGSGPAAATKTYADAGDAAVAAAVPGQVTSGIVAAQQAVPSVFAHRAGSGGISMAVANTVYKIPMVIMVGPIGAWAINGTGGLVCPKRGVYLVSGSVFYNTSATSAAIEWGYLLNAGVTLTSRNRVVTVASANSQVGSFSRLQFLDVGDVIYLAASSNVAANSISDVVEGTQMSAFMVTAVP